MLSLDWQTIYLYGLIVAGSATILYALFSDVSDALDISPHPLLSPIALLSFLAVVCGSGYILTLATTLTAAAVLVLSAVLALILVAIMVFFIFVPLSKAEQSNSIRMRDFIGTFGEVTITVPEQGFGEVIVTRSTGIQNLPAQSMNEIPIAAGTKVFIHDVRDGILLVAPVPQHLLQNMRNEGSNTWQH